MAKKGEYKSLLGNRYGKLLVIGSTPIKEDNRKYFWLCECDCGTKKLVKADNLRSGNTTSCGCKKQTHCMSGTRVYRIWGGMKRRCGNKKAYKKISVCDRWKNFDKFYMDMGDPPSEVHQIDRIDNTKGYYPGNCQWVTCADNIRKKETTKLNIRSAKQIRKMVFAGVNRKCISSIYGISASSICDITKNRTWKE